MYGENLRYEIVFFSFFLLFSFLGLLILSYILYKLHRDQNVLCPYTKKPLRRGEDVPIHQVTEIMRFLFYENYSFDNRIFLMKNSLVCRDTGKVFQDVFNLLGRPKLDWTFLNKRYPGVYVSWGSLSLDQQRDIRESHYTLEGFQTEKSSSKPLPQNIEEEYAYLKPGPLYVDIMTKTLLGWKCVPNTIFEVLIVQHPIEKAELKQDRLQKFRSLTDQENYEN